MTVDFVDAVSQQPTFKQAACRIEKIRKRYRLEPGDTLESVVRQHRLTLEQLGRINRMMPPYRADIGRELGIPSIMNVVIPPFMPYREVDVKPEFRQSKLRVVRMDGVTSEEQQ